MHPGEVFPADILVAELRSPRPEELGAVAAREGVGVPAPLEAAGLHGGSSTQDSEYALLLLIPIESR